MVSQLVTRHDKDMIPMDLSLITLLFVHQPSQCSIVGCSLKSLLHGSVELLLARLRGQYSEESCRVLLDTTYVDRSTVGPPKERNQ